jgi:hypothetical protein
VVRAALVLIVAGIWLQGCACGRGTTPPIPELPAFEEPALAVLPDELEEMCSAGVIVLDADTSGARFDGCLVRVVGAGVTITGSEFIGSRVQIESVSHVVFANNVVHDYRVHETAAVVVSNCSDVEISHNHVYSNAVGLGVGESRDVVLQDNVFERNYQHNAVSLYKSSAEIRGNVFRYNYPHAILAHFVPERGPTSVSVTGNLFDMNIEDAIDFEDWRDASDRSSIAGNVIYRTNWAGINVEYNSWNANIRIEGNYVAESGYPIEEFPRGMPGSEQWSDGWQDAVKLEDCSGVVVAGNVLVHNRGSGVDVSNCRDVALTDNVVAENGVGLRIGGPNRGSFTRDVSPLQQEDASPSEVICADNELWGNGEDYGDQGCE